MTSQWTSFNLDAVIPAWAERTRTSMEDGLRATAPVGNGPTAGQFRDSITATVAGGGLEIDGEGDAVPGTFLVTGTRAHSIDKRPGFLHFIGGDGGEVFTHHVSHPGTAPDPFVENTIDAHEVVWSEDLLDAIAQQWQEK